MTKFFSKNGLLMIALVLVAGIAQAQKFGYVNSAAIINEMPEMKQLKSSLEALQTQLKKKGEAEVTKFQQEQQAAMQKKQRGEMTPKEEEEVANKLSKMEQDIIAMGTEMENTMATKQQEGMEPILKKINDAIQAVAAEGNFQYIFDAQSGVILYADESTDLTEQVKAKLL